MGVDHGRSSTPEKGGKVTCRIHDNIAPKLLVVATATDATPKNGHVSNRILHGARSPGDLNSGATGPASQVRADTDDDHPVPSLWNAEFFGANNEIGRPRRFLQAGLPIFNADCAKFVKMAASGAQRG